MLSDPERKGFKELFSIFDQLSATGRETFVHYVARPHDRRPAYLQTLRGLVPLELPDVDFDSAIDVARLASALPAGIETLASDPPDAEDHPAAGLAARITARLVEIAATDRAKAGQILENLHILLREPFPGKYYSAIDLFRRDAFHLITALASANLTRDQETAFLDACADPMGSALTELATRNPKIPEDRLGELLAHFQKLTGLREPRLADVDHAAQGAAVRLSRRHPDLVAVRAPAVPAVPDRRRSAVAQADPARPDQEAQTPGGDHRGRDQRHLRHSAGDARPRRPADHHRAPRPPRSKRSASSARAASRGRSRRTPRRRSASRCCGSWG